MSGFNQLGRKMSTGIGSFFSDDARRQGETSGLQQVALEDQIEGGRLKMDGYRQDLDLKRREAELKTPAAALARVRQGLGIPAQAEPEVQQYMDSGRIDKYELGPGQTGPVLPAPAWASPDKLSKFGEFFAADQAVQAGSAKSLEDYFKSRTEAATARLTEQTAGGTLSPMEAGLRFYALKGNAPYNFQESGTGNNLTGQVNVDDPRARNFSDWRTQQAAQAKAGAAQNYAQAGAATALANQRRANAGAPGGKIPVGYRYTQDASGEMVLEPIPGGPKDPNAQTGKPLPASAAKGLLENQTNLRRAEAALALAEGKSVDGAAGDVEATGLKGYLPNQALNYVDPKGVDTRAAIADLGSLVIHDRSGAAVTAAEFPRLAPFIPTEKDNPETVRKKLKRFAEVYKNEVGQQIDFYQGSGYNVPVQTLRGANVQDAQSPAASQPVAPARGTVQGGYRFKGGNPAEAANWEPV